MAGSPCPVEVMRRVIERMHMSEVGIAYGMTETSPVSLQTAVDDPISKRVGTVGRVGPHLEVKVVDPESGATVERGEPGELCTRGYSVMLGYWEEPERTAEAIDADRWMHTGDLATMDDEGYVNIVGRIKDLVIRGGENVYPREVEEFLYTHPQVADVQVIGVPDERYGEELMAWVIPRDGRVADGRGDPGVLSRPDRALQDPALRQARRRLSDDRHRQGPEVQDARAGDRRARPRYGGERPDRLTWLRDRPARLRQSRAGRDLRRRDGRRGAAGVDRPPARDRSHAVAVGDVHHQRDRLGGAGVLRHAAAGAAAAVDRIGDHCWGPGSAAPTRRSRRCSWRSSRCSTITPTGWRSAYACASITAGLIAVWLTTALVRRTRMLA